MARDYAYILNQFIKNVKAGNLAFLVKHDDAEYYTHFIGSKIGNAVLYYSARNYDSDFFLDNDVKYEPCSVYTNGVIYVMGCYDFSCYSGKLPQGAYTDGVMLFGDYLKEIQKYFREVAFAKYYAEMEPTKNIIESVIRDDARRHLIEGYDYVSTCRNNAYFGLSYRDARKILVYGTPLDTVCTELLEKHKDTINSSKSHEVAVAKFIESGKAAADWEIEMAQSVQNAKANMVLVEFELDGKTAAAKVESNILLNQILENNYFNTYHFPTEKVGRTLIDTLGASDNRWKDVDKLLCCKNISRIFFRGKPIYERSDNA